MTDILLPPSEKQLEVIMSSLGENEDAVKANIETLRTWLKLQPHLPHTCDDRMLGLFLRGCKQNVSRACRKLEAFYCGRAACPELFADWDPCDEATMRAASLLEVSPLPCLTDEGYRVTVHRFAPLLDGEFSLRDSARLMLMMGELRLNMETVIRGDIYIFDMANVVWAHCSCLLSPLLRKALSLVQDGYPQRLRQLHIINAPSFVNNIVSVFRGLMKEKMRDRFIIHRSVDGLHDFLPKSLIPREYNGYGEDLSEVSKRWQHALVTSRDKLKETSSLYSARKMSNGARRPSRSFKDDQGCQGTFKALEFD